MRQYEYVENEDNILLSHRTIEYSSYGSPIYPSLPHSRIENTYAGDGTWKTSITSFDIAGRARRATVNPGIEAEFTHIFYDHMSNVTRTVISIDWDLQNNPTSIETNFSYDPMGRLLEVVDPAGNTFEYKYDAMGNILTVTSNNQLIQTNKFDGLGRLIESTDAMGWTEDFMYDTLGRLVASRDRNGVVSRFEYKPQTNLLQTRRT